MTAEICTIISSVALMASRKVIIYIMNRYVDADERIVCFDTDWNLLPFNIFTRWSNLMTSASKNLEKDGWNRPHFEQGLPFCAR